MLKLFLMNSINNPIKLHVLDYYILLYFFGIHVVKLGRSLFGFGIGYNGVQFVRNGVEWTRLWWWKTVDNRKFFNPELGAVFADFNEYEQMMELLEEYG